MTLIVNNGDVITLNTDYIDNVLVNLTLTLKQTLETLGSIRGKTATVTGSGTVSTGDATLSFIRLLLNGATKSRTLYFASDDIINRTFSLHSSLPGTQTGYFTVTADNAISTSGLLDPITLNASSTGGGGGPFGRNLRLTSGTSAGDPAILSTAQNEDFFELQHNPFLRMAFNISILGTPIIFCGVTGPTSDIPADVMKTAPNVSVLGLWYEDGVDTNWQFVSNGNGGAVTRVDTGVVVDTTRALQLNLTFSGGASSSGTSASVTMDLRNLGTNTVAGGGELLATSTVNGILGGPTNTYQLTIGAALVGGEPAAITVRVLWSDIRFNT